MRNCSVRKGCVVPPLRRLSSIAYGVQSPASSRTVTKSTAKRPITPSPARWRPITMRRLGDGGGVGGVGGEDAAEVALPAGSAEELVVGREQLDRSVGEGPHLHARAGQLDTGDAFLDDAGVGGEVGEVLLDPDRGILQGHAEQPSLIASGSSAEPGSGRSCRSTSALPEPDTPSLSFTIASVRVGRRRRISWMAATMSSTERRSSAPTGHRTPSSSKIRRQPVLLPRSAQPRVGAVHRDAEAERDVALEVGGVVRDQVAAGGVGDQFADLAQQPGPGQQLLAQRAGRGVAER